MCHLDGVGESPAGSHHVVMERTLHHMNEYDVVVVGVTPGDASAAGAIRFEVMLENGAALEARRVLVTTGLRDEVPDIPGVIERWGRDFLLCPYCHGHEVADQSIGVLGGSPEAVARAHLIAQWSADTVLFAHGSALTAEQREQLLPAPSRSSRGPSYASSSRTTG
jgi:thioredoxin reductase